MSWGGVGATVAYYAGGRENYEGIGWIIIM